MKNNKIRVGIICGGKSAEHEVSLLSVQNIIHALDKEKYEPVLIQINKQGHWLLPQNPTHPTENIPLLPSPHSISDSIGIVPHDSNSQLINWTLRTKLEPLDVIFPVLHGPFGEDGTIQGMLKLMNMPFVGSGVLGSAIGMDKDVMKRLLREAGVPIANFLVFHHYEREKILFDEIVKQLDLPFFVKPANLGSSIGISKVKTQEAFAAALEQAFEYDRKILIEEYIVGREIECAVLGNENPIASVPGEVIVHNQEFYSYEAKYFDETGTVLEVQIPAQLSYTVTEKIKQLALKTFRVCNAEGLARVDFFLRGENEILVNEINTIPGFTNSSPYPKLLEESGIPFSEVIDRLIQLALERHEQEKQLKTLYERKALK